MNSGIYKIENVVTGDLYIGQSVRLIERISKHRRTLIANTHFNPHLQSAWNKYGCEAFVFKTVLFCEGNELTYYEQSLVDVLQPKYNIRKECVNLGINPSDETRARMSESHKGKHQSEEEKRKKSEALMGRSRPAEVRKKISESHKARHKHLTGAQKIHLSIINTGKLSPVFGRKHTEEEKRKMGLGNRGKIVSEETREKLSKTNTGKPGYWAGKHLSEEHKQKISNSITLLNFPEGE